jgi:hypothetical protein
MLDRLKQSKCPVLASQLGHDIKSHLNKTFSKALDQAGGLEIFCLGHPGKIEWIADGCGGKLQEKQEEEAAAAGARHTSLSERQPRYV